MDNFEEKHYKVHANPEQHYLLIVMKGFFSCGLDSIILQIT